jgi:hypothetical protein
MCKVSYMKCRCTAKLDKCNTGHKACPASTWRLIYDTDKAIRELYENARADEINVKKDASDEGVA